MQNSELAKYIDHTLLKPEASIHQIENLCKDADENSFASVCILPTYVKLAAKLLVKSEVKVCTVIGFPLGNTYTGAKEIEAKMAIADGAQELDMVIKISDMINGNYQAVEDDIKAIREIAHNSAATLKVIVETALLSEFQKKKVCEIVSNAGADYIKTSTGFASDGATIDDVILFKENVSKDVRIKASGGIRTPEFAKELISVGATRLGTSSGVKLIK